MKSHPVRGALLGLVLIGLLASCVPVSAPATEMPELPTPTTVTPAGDALSQRHRLSHWTCPIHSSASVVLNILSSAWKMALGDQPF